ncbi:MAG: class I SAM-dependent RNA methyltransferase, partial [Oscillospiraceae bacterium]|nr:class I SAM-dependent RNA methyltransferase [Oscillospiraceae bacterium]
MEKITLTCPCLFGVESILAFEVKKLGVSDVTVSDGRVTFTGTAEDMVRANIQLRCAERVQILLASFEARTFEELFQGVLKADLERYIGENDAFPVKGYSLNSQLHSVPDCQAIIKKAAVKRLEKCYHKSWFEESGPVKQLQFSIYKDKVLLMLDTSGEGLHKRGYRPTANAAPIRETLAACIADLARVKKDSFVADPFCGSGTMLIESALRAMNVAPGLRRHFSFERWHWD